MAAKLVLIVAAMQLGLIPSCPSPVLGASDELIPASQTASRGTKNDCSDPETGWKLEKLNGKVKSLREEQIEYRYGSRNKELARLVTFGPAGDYIKDDQPQNYRIVDYSKISKPTFVFDKACRVLERRDPKRPDRIAGATRTVFSYTPSGTLAEEAIYDPEGRLLWKAVAVLDKNERIIEHKKTSQEHPEHFNPKRYDVYHHWRSIYKLDTLGNQIEEISYNWEGKLHATYKRAYDSSRRLIRELRLDHKERPIVLAIYKFNEAGLLQEELNYYSSGYSGLDELIRGTLDSGFGMFQQGYRITYEYDKSDNWVKKSEYDLAGSGRLSSETFRTLVYY